MNLQYHMIPSLLALATLHFSADVSNLRAQAPTADRSPVVISLFAEATIDDSLVQIAQIAKLTGGSPELRRKIGKLDVAELKLTAERTTVTANQVRFRLLLAGLEASQITLTGAKFTVVQESSEPITLRKVLASAERAFRQKVGGDPSRIAITPAKEIVIPFIEVRASDRIQLDASANLPAPRSEKAIVEVSVVVNGKSREVIPVHLNVSMPEAVARDGPRNLAIRPVAGIINQADPFEVVVKNRDLVKIVANIGSARIEATGEAMQDGKLGELIRVRNTESNRVIFGKVEAHGTVLVGY